MMATRTVATLYEAWRLARAAAPYSVCAADVHGDVDDAIVVTICLWPGLEPREWTVRERIRTALRAAVPGTVGVEVLTLETRGPA